MMLAISPRWKAASRLWTKALLAVLMDSSRLAMPADMSGWRRWLQLAADFPPLLANAATVDGSPQNLAQEQLGALVLRVGEERLGLVHLDDLAGIHEHHPVGDL